MNHAKYQQMVDGQTSIAQKVLSVVPLQEEWESRKIMAELFRVTHSAPDLRVVEGCLRNLVAAGLVKQVARDSFRRLPAPPKASASPPPEQIADVATVTAQSVSKVGVAPVLDRMANAAVSLRAAANMLTSVANELEEVALQAQQQIEDERTKGDKYRQLGSLLQELGISK